MPAAPPPVTPVVLVWPLAGNGDWTATLRDVLSADARLLLPDSRYGAALLDAIAPAARANVTVLDGVGERFAAALDEAVGTSGPADLVVVADTSSLPAGWLDGLRRAALAADPVFGASPLVVDSGELEESREGSRQGTPLPATHPRTFALSPGCAYLRRPALELLGAADTGFSHPGAVLDDLAARALACGLSCVLADDVWVQRLPGGLGPCPAPERRRLSERHPWFEAAREEAGLELGPLRRSLLAARGARRRLSVTIDARGLGPSFGGTESYTASLVRALAQSGRLRLRVVVGDVSARRALAAEDVEVLTYEQVVAGVPLTDVVHRPQQVFTPDDLALLRMMGERLVITHLDLIAFRNPAYHAGVQQWRSYRRTTRLALGLADRVVFLSEHARRDAIAEALVEARETAVVGIGIEADHGGASARRPDPVPEDRDLLVMVGADYLHKNRPFAIAVLGELVRRGWPGLLVLAGRHVAHGSSAELEAELLRRNPELAGRVLDLGPVGEDEKRWLLSHAQALLCPSTYEGYGLTPLEAASVGLPCAYAPTTSLTELLGAEAATIVPWDPSASADRVQALLTPGPESDRHLRCLAAALDRCRWGPLVDRLLEVYGEAVVSPYRPSNPRAWEELAREQFLVDQDASYQDLQDRTAHGLALIDRDGLLTRAQQRGLMRVALRPWLRPWLLGPLGKLGELRSRAPTSHH